ncbi:MAG TPA: efflux RND transporter periplasmic adaptor subunit [Vicinamibacterales bacterium]|nr:efflux RND transporter periplasmic adaptor subunit [Vicinamibacterales bacterium]
MKRAVKIVLGAIAVVALGVWAFRPAAVPADIVAIERGALEVTVTEEGRTRVRDRFVVSAPLPGRMERIELEPGDPVVAGRTVVARFRPSDPALLDVRTRAELEGRARAADAAVGAARSEHRRLEADLAFAQAELRRARQLVAEKVISAREMEAAERQAESLTRALQSAAFNVRTAEHQLEVARASLMQTRGGRTAAIPLYSPVDGVILRRLQESETVVPPGQPLLEIGNVDDLEIVSDLLSSAAVRVKPGQPVIVEQWGGDRPLRGRVRRIEPSGFTKISALGVEEQRVNTIIDFEDPPDARGGIGDGFRVEVRIIVSARENVLKVPTSALVRQGDEWAVFVVDGGRAVRRVVQIGRRNGLEAEVTGGLAGDERIIVYPSDAVDDGVRVRPRT